MLKNEFRKCENRQNQRLLSVAFSYDLDTQVLGETPVPVYIGGTDVRRGVRSWTNSCAQRFIYLISLERNSCANGEKIHFFFFFLL